MAPLNKILAESCDFIDEVIVDKGQSIWSFASELRALDIDTSITLFSNTRMALVQFLARIPKRIAPATKIAQIFYTHRVKQRRSEVKMAEFEYNLELARALFKDINLEYKKPLLEFKNSSNEYKGFVCFHVGFGGSSDANWNLDEYEELIREALKRNKVILTFGPDEKELLKNMQSRFKNEDIVFYLSVDGLVEFAKLISSFKLFVSTSTGTYHLASLVGTPTMTFFADSLFASSKRWKGIGEEKLQQNYMIPSQKEEKEKLFQKIKKSLSSL